MVEDADTRFNKELDRYICGELRSNEHLSIGLPMGVMAYFLPQKGIILRQKVLTKAVKKHGMNASDIKNLPSALTYPIFVFQSDNNTISVLTELKTKDRKNVFVAIKLDAYKQFGHRFLEVNDILTIHGREEENIINPIVENKSLIWVDKKKGQDWLSSAKSNSQAITNDDLISCANIVNDFENPKITTEKISMKQPD